MLTALHRFYLYDLTTVASLALILALRTRVAGLPAVGAILASVFATMLWPLTRELFLTGSVKPVFTNIYLQVAIFLGAAIGAYLARFSWRAKILIWGNILTISLLASFGLLWRYGYICFVVVGSGGWTCAIIVSFRKRLWKRGNPGFYRFVEEGVDCNSSPYSAYCVDDSEFA